MPNVVEIGGIHIEKSREPLPYDLKGMCLKNMKTFSLKYFLLKELLDNANDGVVYISWGSIINSQGMSLSKKQEIVEAFKLFPQIVFLWKWENDTVTATGISFSLKNKFNF